MGRLAQSSLSDNESPQTGLPPTAPPQSPPLRDNNGYATDDIYEEFDQRRQSSGSASTRTFSVTNESQLRGMSSDSVDTIYHKLKLIRLMSTVMVTKQNQNLCIQKQMKIIK